MLKSLYRCFIISNAKCSIFWLTILSYIKDCLFGYAKKCQWQIGMNKSYEPFRTRFQTHPKCFCRPLWVKSDEMCTHAARLYWEMLLLPTSLKGAPLLYFEDWKILRSTLSCKPDRVYVIRGNKYLSFRTISSTISTIKKIAGILIEWKRHKSHIVLP